MATAKLLDVDLYYDEFGLADDPVLVLIPGLGAQLLNYPDEFCLAFVDRGMRVVRFDNRDAGLSTHVGDDVAYSLSDMASDVVGLLDVLGIESCHLWGSSMGGMIAQVVAIDHPARVRTLISVQSTTGEPEVGLPDPVVLEELLGVAVPAASRSDAIDKAVRLSEVLTNNEDIFDADAQRSKAERAYDRAYDPAGNARQVMAVVGAPSRVEGLRSLGAPTLVIHGNRDPLIGISGGRRTAELIPDATFLEVDGMGHDLNSLFWSQYVDAVVAHVARMESTTG